VDCIPWGDAVRRPQSPLINPAIWVATRKPKTSALATAGRSAQTAVFASSLPDEEMMRKRGGLSPYCPKVQGTPWVHVPCGYLLANLRAFLMELL
jgi:hypothetical protein